MAGGGKRGVGAARGHPQGQNIRDVVRRFWPRVFLIVPFALVIYVPLYNRVEPTLGGIPFFYWYQLAAILVGATVVMGVYLLEKRCNVAPRKQKQAGSEETGTPSSNEPGAGA